MQSKKIGINLKNSRKFVILIFIFVISIIFAKNTLSAEYIGWRIRWHHKKQIVIVKRVGKNTPADKAGIKVNDIIVNINNEKLTKSSYIHMGTKRILRGEKIIVQLIRNGKNISLPISIPAFPASEGKNIKGGNYLLLNIEPDNDTGAIFGYLWDWGATPKNIRTEQRLKDKVCSRYHSSVINIICEAPISVDLTDERTVIHLIEKAKKYAFRSCPNLKDEKMKVNISIYEGKYDNKRRGRFAPIFASFNYFSSPNYDKMQTYKNKIAEKAKRKKRKEKQIKTLAAQTGKHKQNAPEPAQRIASAKLTELEKRLSKEAGMSATDSGTKFTVVDKDSRAVFTLLMLSEKSYGCGGIVIGEIPEHIDLTDDTVAKGLLRKGDMFAESKCQANSGANNFKLYLRKAKFEMPWLVRGRMGSGVILSYTYRNKAKELAQKEQKKAEEEQKKLLAQKRLDNFEKKYGVTDWPVMKEFHVNPFIYEGKKVAFVSEFGTMLSATEGVFECSGELFIVSDIPKGFFTKEAEVVIAGRPLGKKETKLPLLGEVLVPNLKFAGAYLCEKQHCRDMVWK